LSLGSRDDRDEKPHGFGWRTPVKTQLTVGMDLKLQTQTGSGPERETPNIALMLSHDPGRAVAAYFASRRRENIVAVYFENDDSYASDITALLGIEACRVFFGKPVLSNRVHIDWLASQNVDFVVTVYWPWLLSNAFLHSIRDSVNFHPSLLPANRGWYPHVHSIVNGSPNGVSLHRISERADEGAIWAQRSVTIPLTFTAKSAYLDLQNEIVDLFTETWDRISSGQLEPTPQSSVGASYHHRAELEELDRIDLGSLTGLELYNILRARTFGARGYAYIEIGGKKHYLSLGVEPEL